MSTDTTAIREYWTRQWAMIDGRAEPAGFSAGADGTTNVDVRLFVRDLEGNALSDKMVVHSFRIEDVLVTRSPRRHTRRQDFLSPGEEVRRSVEDDGGAQKGAKKSIASRPHRFTDAPKGSQFSLSGEGRIFASIRLPAP